MKYYHLLLFILFGLAGSSSILLAQENFPDSLIDIKAARYIAETDPDKAMRIVELVRKQNETPQFQIDWVTAQIYGKKGLFRMAIETAKHTLKNDSVRNNPQYFVNLCSDMVETMIYLEDYEEAVKYTNEMLKQLDKVQSIPGVKHSPTWMKAKIYRKIGDKEKAYTFIDEAINMVKLRIKEKTEKNMSFVYEYTDLIAYYRDLASWKAMDDDFATAIQVTLKEYKTLEKLEAFKGGPYPKQIPSNAFEKKRAYTTALLAYYYAQSNQIAKSDHWFQELQKSPEINDSDVQNVLLNYYQAKKDYKNVIKTALPFSNFSKAGDSINTIRRMAYLNLADAYQKIGQPEQALSYTQRALAQTDSLNYRKQKNNALEMMTIYETQEKEKQIQEQKVELQTNRILLFTAIGIGLLLGLLLWLKVYSLRQTRHKNRIMVKQINELLSYRDELNLIKKQIHGYAQPANPSEEEIIPEEKNENISEEIGSTNEVPSDDIESRKRFEELEYIMITEQLYLNPELTRDSLVKRTRINKNRIAQIIQTFAGTNFNGYVNNMRLEHSILLLRDYKNHTVQAVATDSGFNNVRTFYRLFREKYGMTPIEYRQTILDM
ncbi:helix-turn-helix domain-containing protein [Parabacteroides sp. AM08-6]|uniref:helix-turn-helix domain-containing protein n=1 Tax=Parabacteroides sp. AM08-6 TaxID=2292053 RepID=UPI000F001D43|nr:helix-turn-helix domain-containing protein [Parabacteroides sp. AM08-6]RHJ81488.1 AraC family transcriptional regulator [Parabacteroides sp. AM08-6]